jgi:type I restriction-modification system DNA methylase subunit
MYNLQKNNYHQKPKSSTIYTPPAVSQFIYELLKDKVKRGTILDPCSGQGSLLRP